MSRKLRSPLCLITAWLLTACAGDGGTSAPVGDAAPPARDQGTGCTSTCADDGLRECRDNGVRVCGDADGDGCLTWSEVSPCQGACAEGQCVDCTNDCQAGSVQCGPQGGIQTCVTSGDGDPCFEWGSEAPCEAGESCSAGQCRPVGACEDECVRNDRRCNGEGFQLCGPTEADTCMHWGPVTACGAGESCSNGSCRSTCVDECVSESRRCRAEGYEQCGHFDDDPCAEWSQVVPCPGGEVCSGGRCAASCADECNPEGQRRCSANGWARCERAASGCLAWGAVSPCEAGQTCAGGECRAACVDECALGSAQCQGNGVVQCGNFDDDPCAEWSEAIPCDEGESCSGGACAVQCINECGVANQRQCSGNGVAVCGNHDADPCLEWGTPTGCPGTEVCSGGACLAQCADECADGSVQCAAGGPQRCGNFDADGCREWSAPTPCAEGQGCSLGRCVAQCQDECLLGLTRCGQNGVETCGQVDDDPCTDWGPAAPCAAGLSCSNGACSAVCVDECSTGARRCRGEAFEVCGNFDADNCQEWSVALPCEVGQVCSGGVCGAQCRDECVRGSVQCGSGGVQTCGNYDADNCQEWSAALACPVGETCSAGRCAPFCQDECRAGATRCGASGVETCGNFDADSCQEWGAGVACPVGQACSNGACAAQCADECAVGATRCEGNGFVSCGQFDADACREWSATSPCDAGEICQAGVCAPFVLACDTDADCGDGYLCASERCVAARACATDAQCAAGERCDALAQVCRPSAGLGVGGACALDTDCALGLLCLGAELGGYCTAGCDDTTPCQSGSTCYLLDEAQGVSACLRDCADAAGCEDGQACFPTGVSLGGACFFADCRQDAECQTDPLIQARCVEGQCLTQNTCDLLSGEGCAAGLTCVQYEGQGICLATCEVFGAACATGRCVPNGGTDEGYCLPSGAGVVGAGCDTAADCQASALCVADGTDQGTCRTLCDTQAATGCPATETCVAVGERAGACLAPCESECGLDEIRCESGRIGRCGQVDDDVCLEWLGAVSCGTGQTCNEVESACAPACATDADCPAGLLTARCVAGACELVSECDPGTGEGCQGADQCYLITDDGSKGACLEPCDPLNALECSLGDEACVGFGSGQGFCAEPGLVPVGGACEWATDCDLGATCVGVPGGGGACFMVCNVQTGTGCSQGETCQDLEIDGRLGICAEACEDACTAGAGRCTAAGLLESCGYESGALCTSWLGAISCGEGFACNPETNACEAGCANDAECAFDDGVPWVCEAGQCVLADCTVNGQACAAGEPESVCVPTNYEAPAQGGLCLVGCDPLAPDCGAAGMCDYVNLTAQTTDFVCLPAGTLGRYDLCTGFDCGPGLTCLAVFEGDQGETIAACVAYCQVGQAGDCESDETCYDIPIWAGDVGFCGPSQ